MAYLIIMYTSKNTCAPWQLIPLIVNFRYFYMIGEIKSMKEMFPDLEEQKLLETLQANDYSTDAAVSELLGVNEKGQIYKYIL